MRNPEVKSYAPPFELGKPITNTGIAKILKSDNERFKEGDVVRFNGTLPTEEYSVLSSEIVKTAEKLDNPFNLDMKLFVGPLGMPGLTAYSSFYAIGEPKKGETIFISAASGAVGQLVGQLAKHEGLKVIGSVGDDKKLEFIEKELGFDAGFNYKKEKSSDGLKRTAPQGLDIYYENVGGETLEAAINAMNNFGRISRCTSWGISRVIIALVVRTKLMVELVACGMISQYNLKPSEAYGVKNLMQVVGKRLKMQGFIVGDENMGPKYKEEHQKNVQKWIHDGTFKVKMDETRGIDNAAEGLLAIYEGITAVLHVRR